MNAALEAFLRENGLIHDDRNMNDMVGGAVLGDPGILESHPHAKRGAVGGAITGGGFTALMDYLMKVGTPRQKIMNALLGTGLGAGIGGAFGAMDD